MASFIASVFDYISGFVVAKDKIALSTSEWKKFPLAEKIQISPNTAKYRFTLDTPDSVLGLPVGQHISVRTIVDGKTVSRSYTPTSEVDQRGSFELVVKTYPNGVLSKVFSELKVGDMLEVQGPKGKFQYKPNLYRAFGMVCGGTGLTPMYQVIKTILKNPADKTQMSLIYANVNVEDILLKAELDELCAKHDNLKTYYVLNNPPEGWEGGVGFVTKEMIEKHCPAPAKDVKLLLCGPPPMIKAMCGHTEAIGFEKVNIISKMEDQVFKF